MHVPDEDVRKLEFFGNGGGVVRARHQRPQSARSHFLPAYHDIPGSDLPNRMLHRPAVIQVKEAVRPSWPSAFIDLTASS
jgi:hypothetical protein